MGIDGQRGDGAAHRSAAPLQRPRSGRPSTTGLRPGPRWRGLLLYPAALVAVFLGGQLLLGLVGVPVAQQPTLAALPALASLLLSLPARLRRVWGEGAPWTAIGLRAPAYRALAALGQGCTKAALLLSLVVIALALTGWLTLEPRFTLALLLNGVLLGLGVGLAEELLFRGWLLGELTLLLGGRRALMVQALVFSLVHTRFQLLPLELVGLLGGLWLLGVSLGLQRRANDGLLWGAIGLHGGLVGGWFLLQAGLLRLSPAMPAWLSGPGGAGANPIGGVVGWLGLCVVILKLNSGRSQTLA
ncbi:MAG: type II CAAX prenyl endopeptidase Rce1 family protein [Cyanobium sp.]